MGKYFSDIYDTKESQIFREKSEIEDTEDIIEAKREVLNNLTNYDSYIKLGKAFNYHLRYREAIEAFTEAICLNPDKYDGYRARAIRYLNTFQFDKAFEDFKYCYGYDENSLDILYRLGLTEYLRKNYDEAYYYFYKALNLDDINDEMLVAVIYWGALTAMRMTSNERFKIFISRYNKNMDVGHHTAYKMIAEVFIKCKTVEEVLENMKIEEDDLEYSIVMYGIYNILINDGRMEDGEECLDDLLKRDYFWAGFAYLAALNDRYPYEKVNKDIKKLVNI